MPKTVQDLIEAVEADERLRAEWLEWLKRAERMFRSSEALSYHDPDPITDNCRRCGARREEIDDNLVRSCDPVAVRGLREAQVANAIVKAGGRVRRARLALPYKDPSPELLDLMRRLVFRSSEPILKIVTEPAAVVPVDPWDRPLSRSIIDEWTRRR